MVRSRDIVLMLFDNERIKDILEQTGYRIKDKKIFRKDGTQPKCRICEEEITVKNLGRVLPGSFELYCDDPTCFNDFSVKLL